MALLGFVIEINFSQGCLGYQNPKNKTLKIIAFHKWTKNEKRYIIYLFVILNKVCI